MSQMLLKHAVLLGFAIPMSFVGYHALYGMGDGDGDAEAAARRAFKAMMTMGKIDIAKIEKALDA